MTDLQCIHVDMKKHKDKSIYIYKISSKQDVILCPDCNMILAGGIMKQLATEVFLDTRSLDKVNPKEVKDGRTKRRSGKPGRKKSKN